MICRKVRPANVLPRNSSWTERTPMPKVRFLVRHRQSVEVSELRIHDVVVAMSQLPARKTPSEDTPAVDVFVDRIEGRESRGRGHPTHMSIPVDQEKLCAFPAKRMETCTPVRCDVGSERTFGEGVRQRRLRRTMMTSLSCWPERKDRQPHLNRRDECRTRPSDQ